LTGKATIDAVLMKIAIGEGIVIAFLFVASFLLWFCWSPVLAY